MFKKKEFLLGLGDLQLIETHATVSLPPRAKGYLKTSQN